MRLRVVLVAGMMLAARARAGGEDAPETPRGRQSYEMGVAVGQSLAGQGLDLDADHLARGLRDGLASRGAGDEAAQGAVAPRERRSGVRAPAPVSPGEARRRGEAFLAANAKKEGVVTLPSGLQYRILKRGEGPVPTDRDWVVCHYRGTLVDGTAFEDSHSRGQPATLPIARVVPGWREALKLMPVGSKWQIVVPARLGYGEQGGRRKRKAPGRIGPNETLIIETELLGIRPGPGSPGTKTAAAAEQPAVRGN